MTTTKPEQLQIYSFLSINGLAITLYILLVGVILSNLFGISINQELYDFMGQYTKHRYIGSWSFNQRGMDAIVAKLGVSLSITSFFFLGTAIAFLIWIYRIAKNMVTAEVDKLKYKPGFMIWTWFVPMANLVLPYNGMVDIWENLQLYAYGRVRNLSLVIVFWWLGMIIALVVYTMSFSTINISSLQDVQSNMSWGYTANIISIITAVLAIYMIFKMTKFHKDMIGKALREAQELA